MVLTLIAIGGRGALPAKAAGPTVIDQDITTSTTWIAADSPYQVSTNTVSVINGAVLTIEPGVTVEFQNDARLQIQNGQLVAVGTPTQLITFTPSSSSPVRGIWEGIVFATDALTSSLEYAMIEYARGAIQVSNNGKAPFSLQYNTIRYAGDNDGNLQTGGAIVGGPEDSMIAFNTIYSAEVGINLIRGATHIITANQLYDIDGYCLGLVPSIGNNAANNTVANNRIYDCRNRGIFIEGLSSAAKGSGNIVTGNSITNTNGEGIYAVDQTLLQILGNTIRNTALTTTIGTTGTGSNIAAIALVGVDPPNVQNNQLLFNGGPGNYQGALYITDTTSPLSIMSVQDNLIRGNTGNGVVFASANNAPFQLINGNALCVEGGGVEAANSHLTQGLSAAGNWWSTNTPASGSEYSGNVTVNPPIVLTGTATASAIPADGSSTTDIVITMNDGAGNTVPGPARVLSVTTNFGSVTPLVTLNANGVATAILTAAAFPATATITV
ncbi:MAG: right-handed parallel beta-helix repeat-containing protein, partial [Anaerolineae bacterium]